MAKKVYIAVGHGGSDPGAVANGVKEKDVNLSIANYCTEYLKARGVLVEQSRIKDVDPVGTVRKCNEYAPDVAVSIHNNAGGGDGAEVYHTRFFGKGHTLAVNILNEMIKIGQNSRGTKVKKNSRGSDYFEIIRETKMPTVLVECAFIDNKTDLQIIDTEAERKAMGEAIARGILKTIGVADIVVEQKTTYKGAFPKLPERNYFKKGDNGNEVRRLQSFLNWYGNYKLAVDGDLGNKTLNAVKSFQKAEKLVADGLFGKKSLERAKIVKK